MCPADSKLDLPDDDVLLTCYGLCFSQRREHIQEIQGCCIKSAKTQKLLLPAMPAKRTTGKTRPKNDRGAYPSNLFRLVSFQKRAWSPPWVWLTCIPFKQSGCDTLVLNSFQTTLCKSPVSHCCTTHYPMSYFKVNNVATDNLRDHSRIISTSRYAWQGLEKKGIFSKGKIGQNDPLNFKLHTN